MDKIVDDSVWCLDTGMGNHARRYTTFGFVSASLQAPHGRRSGIHIPQEGIPNAGGTKFLALKTLEVEPAQL